ncbi:sulfur carrier protein ThiS [Alkalibacillus haloalkaliphilus]|uniref:Sulfur carrier protein ThiS n=1 Tax=Alkalibacillus haloalkaliphilus TaxID=94136 RepID=A0A511W762_9BACI|nr:sulfur carrier protein ThiS [Alkalibacillus haloalkaliphilus]GEN46148.1 sulfur carrier protein ThiS [Alkalibacillus haloalkaliphilus]
MVIHVNGEQRELSNDIQTVSDLLNHFELGDKKIIVELNANIVDSSQHEEITVQDGDRVELVHFVGGG